jgi:poly(3-hydroxybutyrate) depolymerase
MNRRAFGTGLVALAVANRPVAATVKTSRHFMAVAGRRRTFYLFDPESDPSPAPLLVLLHGSGQTALNMLNEWVDPPPAGVVLVAPDAASREQWELKTDGPVFVREVVKDVSQRRAIDPARIYLFGHSGGAVYALTLAMLESQFFAAVAVHAGAWRRPGEFTALKLARRKIPVAIWVGDIDPLFPLAAVRATGDALRAEGHPVEVTVLERHGHRYAHVASRVNRAAWEFLRRRSL